MAPDKKKGGQTGVCPPRSHQCHQNFARTPEEHAFAESLVANAAVRVVELDLLLVEQIHDVRKAVKLLVDVPARRGVERAVVIIELRQTAAAAGGDAASFRASCKPCER